MPGAARDDAQASRAPRRASHSRHDPLVCADPGQRLSPPMRCGARGGSSSLTSIYSVLYASTSDSRWHECGHGTAFKTDWMNNALYEIASFMVMRESTVWRWSHTRHHSDTIIVGRDPEIAVPRPPDVKAIIMSFFNLRKLSEVLQANRAALVRPHDRRRKDLHPRDGVSQGISQCARIYVAIYLAVIGLAIYTHSFLPLFLVGFTNFFGTWLLVVYGLTQHAGLAENVLDHRLNCRTVYMNPIHRYLYWNMNYHVEHHMFPLVPYHRQRELARSGEGRLPHAVSEPVRGLARNSFPPFSGRSRIPRITSNASFRSQKLA